MALLDISNLGIGYPPGKKLMEEINLSLDHGQLIGLVGQNGVGKSTLIRTICGLQPKLSGKVFLTGDQIEELPAKEIAKKISVVLTGRPESLNLSVLELVALGRHPYSGWLGNLKSSDREKIEEAISLMEINYLAKKRLYELSDGQMQKVMIARALAQETDLIILDEPTSHLDLKNKIDVLQLLQKIAKSGKGVLISTHEIQLSAQVCDLFWCMDFGQKMLVGEPEKIIGSGELQDYLHIPKSTLL
ncbi:ABC transporter ATP-binding protein [Ekhidna sp.]|uniref:ABC transporter ATP-binding protein n=1 Tax=Ekhidna sp. TaxID=2608089 RepID=UPI003B5A3497